MDLEGVKVHTTIGVAPATGQMTGIFDRQVLIEDREKGRIYDSNSRSEPTGLESEREKWIRSDSRALGGLPEGIRPTQVYDRGADAFLVFKKLWSERTDGEFVERANQNRCIRMLTGREDHLVDRSKTLPEKGRARIHVQQGGDREGRESTLSVRAGACELLPPKNDPGEKGPVEVNVVRGEKIRGGEDLVQEDPTQCVLLTTEPTSGFKKALRTVDCYRSRWKIEEFRKALKTGCRIEDRQLQTWERMEVLLSIYSTVEGKYSSCAVWLAGSRCLLTCFSPTRKKQC